ncbi:MAG: hypothetical protein HRU07_00140 [Nitrosopumilus sp.]|nr:hypothetical protein [Nitrosopumilus sp.]NRA04590.1 hypothetical protein [Nitrosopumilus sp.]
MFYQQWFPAIPKSNPLEESIKDAEKRAYILRLRNKTFFDLELSQCETLEQVLQLTQKRQLGIKLHENGLKWHESKKLARFKFYSDSDDYAGIPISVTLNHKIAASIIEQQKRNSYKVFSNGEIFSQEEWETKEKEFLEKLVQDKQEIPKIISEKTQQTNLEKINPTNTEHIYELAKRSEWKLMLDFQGYTLPGSADQYETCGKWRFSKCRDYNYGKRIVHSCNRLSCPVCVQKAGMRIAKKIERRIWLYRLMIQKTTNQKRNSKPSHVVESIPADDIFWSYSKSKQQRILKQMRRIAGITGGVSITHYWRFETGKTKPYVSIHNHLIAFGWISPTAKEDIYKKFGINVVYHKPIKGTLHERKNVFSVAFYLLSHCAIKNHKHSVHWFGELSYRKIKNSYLKKFRDDNYILEDEDIEKSKSCKLCGETLVPAKINKDYHNWQGFLPDDDAMSEGCMFAEGLLLEIDMISGEKMEFYDESYHTIHHKTKKQRELERIENNPLIYNRITSSQKIKSWMDYS